MKIVFVASICVCHCTVIHSRISGAVDLATARCSQSIVIDERCVPAYILCKRWRIFCIAIDDIGKFPPYFGRWWNIVNGTPKCGMKAVYVCIVYSKHAFDQNVGHTNKSTFNNDKCCVYLFVMKDRGWKGRSNRLRLYICAKIYSVEYAHLPVLSYVLCAFKVFGQNNILPCSVWKCF